MAEADMSAGQLPLDGIGVRLRRARETAGLSLADVAARTKIQERHLALIEKGDFGELPARTYAVGFSRSYARVVGMDEGEVISAVRAELNEADFEPAPHIVQTFEPGDPARVPGAGLAWLAALLAIVIVAAGMVFWRSYYIPGVDLPSFASAPAAPQAAKAPAKPAPLAAPTGGPVVFTALEDGVWVKFYDGAGMQLMQKQMALSESYSVPDQAQNVQLWTARPDALAITIGGKPVPKLSDVQVTMKDVPVSAVALLARGAVPLQATQPAVGAMPVSTAPRAAAQMVRRSAPRRAERPAENPANPASSASAAAGAAPAAAAQDAASAPRPQASTVSE